MWEDEKVLWMDGGHTTVRMYLMSLTVNLNTVKMVNTKDTLVIVSSSSEVKIRFSLLPPRGCRTAVREAARAEHEAGLTSPMGQWRGLAVLG